MSRNKQTELAKTKIIDIFTNINPYLDQLKQLQDQRWRGVSEVRDLLSPLAPILLFPVLSDRITAQSSVTLNKQVITKDGKLRYFFEDGDTMDVIEKGTKNRKKVSAKEAQRVVVKNLCDTILSYLTNKGTDGQDSNYE